MKSPRAFLAGFLVAAGLAAGLLPVRARALENFDFEGPVFYRPGELVKDHSLVRIDGVFHLYYITTGEKTFGHATSPDLRHWTRQPDALAAGPDAWDATSVWAPTVVRYPYSPYYLLMYYTGVNAAFAQQTGLAMSNSPARFNKAPSELFTPFHGDTTWMYWHESQWSNYRDPGFYRENDTCYLVHTAHTIDWKGAIALASSTDYFTWKDEGPIFVINNWHALESAFLLKREGLYHLFFTEETVGGVSHMSSPSLRSGWNIATRTIVDGGAAGEVLRLDDGAEIFSRHSRYATSSDPIASIRFDTLTWYGDQPYVRKTNMLGGWTVLWGKAFDRQPVFGDNPAYRGGTKGTIGYEGNWWIGTAERFNGPLSGTMPGAAQGDAARGAIRSKTFVVTGLSMRLLVGGGAFPDSCYVALCDAGTGEILCRETGKNTDRMDERIWDLGRLRGRPVYLTIVDNCVSAHGHINVDGIEERLAGASGQPGGHTHSTTGNLLIYPEGDPSVGGGASPGPDSNLIVSPARASRAPGADATGARATPRVSSSPNPFNPMTEISAWSAPGENVVVSIYDIAGRSLRDMSARTDARGEARVRWSGVDRRGAPLPSGVYFAVLSARGRVLASSKLVLAR